MADPRFWAKLARRAAAAEAATPARRVADLAEEIRRLQAERMRHVSQATGRVREPELIPYVDELDNDIVDLSGKYDAASEAARLASTPYLERLTRAYRQPGEPDMSLDSPLFRDMYKADTAFEQLRKGRTSNLRNAGGSLADIASQAIREADAAAVAGRTATAMDSAREMGPEAAVAMGILGGTAVAAPAGMAIESAMAARRQRQEEALAAQRAAEAFAAEQAAMEQQYLNDIDGFDPIAADVVSPEFDEELLAAIAAQSYPAAIRPRSAGAVEAYARKQGFPTFPGTVLEDEALPRRRPAPHYMAPLGANND